MLSEAQRFWDAISGKVRQLIRGETQNAMRCERYEVTTAPNGVEMGVSKPYSTNELMLPYSSEVANAQVGDPVLVVWWNSMSNAKVCYYADGYRGGLAAYPVGSYYWSSVNTSPAVLFGGEWESITNRFLFAAGGSYSVTGSTSTGGEINHTLKTAELPSIEGTFRIRGAGNTGVTPAITASSGAFSGGGEVVDYNVGNKFDLSAATGGNQYSQLITMSFGSGSAHNNMPPYKVAYCWHRTG